MQGYKSCKNIKYIIESHFWFCKIKHKRIKLDKSLSLLFFTQWRKFIAFRNKNAFQEDAYRPNVDRIPPPKKIWRPRKNLEKPPGTRHPPGPDTPLKIWRTPRDQTPPPPWGQTPPLGPDPPGPDTPWARHPPGTRPTPQTRHPPCEQDQWQTLVKILPWPKLRFGR